MQAKGQDTSPRRGARGADMRRGGGGEEDAETAGETAVGDGLSLMTGTGRGRRDGGVGGGSDGRAAPLLRPRMRAYAGPTGVTDAGSCLPPAAATSRRVAVAVSVLIIKYRCAAVYMLAVYGFAPTVPWRPLR